MDLPIEFVVRMKESLDSEYSAFEASLENPAPSSIHLHPNKSSSTNSYQSYPAVPWYPSGRYLPSRPLFTADPLFHAGSYYSQEASSMAVAVAFRTALGHTDNPYVLDLCAAPGGKSTLLLSILNGKGLVVANEVISNRIPALTHNLIKWGYSNQVITRTDPSDFGRLPNFFDIILVDAPCSGEGLFRKDPESREQWSAQHVHHAALRQKRILADIIPALKPGGLLIYSTCTYSKEENIDQIDALIQSEHFQPIRLPILDAAGFERQEKNRALGYQAYPHRLTGEGFFISALQKVDGGFEKIHTSKKINWLPSNNTMEEWIEGDPQPIFDHKGVCCIFPDPGFLETISAVCRVVKAGTKIGCQKGPDFIPDHELAMSVHICASLPSIPLSIEQSIEYLKKNSISNTENQKGLYLVTYQDLPLGWLKGVSGRFNNLYPIDYRIKSKYIG
jgi:16S rRNA C967 or C1407 C5-methylase (RsmB/RsmF family)/NOL1/NOP2/fmu family ribosome biogenesis protein